MLNNLTLLNKNQDTEFKLTGNGRLIGGTTKNARSGF